MDEIFRAYNGPLIIEGSPGFTAERWEGLKGWSASAVKEEIAELVDAAYGTGLPPKSLVSALQSKDESLTFSLGGPSSRQFSAAGLDYLFTHNGKLDKPAALAVLTADFGSRKPPSLSVDIAGRAAAELDSVADSWRSREGLQSEIAAITVEAPASKAIAEIADVFDAEHTTAALTDILKAVGRSLDKLSGAARTALKRVERRLDQIDEEADVLWFVFAGEGEVAGGPFGDMSLELAPLAAGIDLADRTEVPLHSRTFAALVKRLGVPSGSVQIQAAIEAAPAAFLSERVPREASSRIMPLHRMMDRYREFGSAGPTWCAGSEGLIGFAPDLEVSTQEFALQVYRERMLIKALGI